MSLNEVNYQKIGASIIITPRETMHDSYVQNFISKVLDILTKQHPKYLILDLSHIETVDSFMGRTINELVRSAKLVGVESSAIGIKPEVAITLVELGFTLVDIKIYRTLEQAIKTNDSKGV